MDWVKVVVVLGVLGLLLLVGGVAVWRAKKLELVVVVGLLLIVVLALVTRNPEIVKEVIAAIGNLFR